MSAISSMSRAVLRSLSGTGDSMPHVMIEIASDLLYGGKWT